MKIKNFLRQMIVTFNVNLALANSRNCYKGEISLEDRRIRSMFRNGILYRDDGRFRKKQQEQEWEGYYNE